MSNSKVYVSGATGHLGGLVSKALAESGHSLVLGGQNREKLIQLQKVLTSSNPHIEINLVQCGLDIPSQWNDAANEIWLNGIEAYVNCSGVQGSIKPSLDLSTKELEHVMNVNLFSSIFFTNFFVNQLSLDRKFKIIHFSGGGGAASRRFFMAYSLSKTALARFVENFSLESQHLNLSINSVSPGIMPSKMQREILDSGLSKESMEVQNASKIFNQKQTKEPRVLDLVRFLLSDQSDGISGKLVSAEWDNWEAWPENIEELKSSDIYTLRRITGRERNSTWGDN